MVDLPRQSWMDAEPDALEREKQAMAEFAPDMLWDDDAENGAWEGQAPCWPFDRPEPAGLQTLLEGRRFRLRVEYRQSFPAVEPRLIPLEPEPDVLVRAAHDWHLNGDGSLCLLRDADMWDGRATSADLVMKASGWFIEYLLLEAGHIEKMTSSGINIDDQLDSLIASLG